MLQDPSGNVRVRRDSRERSGKVLNGRYRVFGAIKNTYKKSEAAVVVQNVLEISVRTGLGGSIEACAKLANRLVAIVWDERPDLYSGKFGQRPHKISVAAAALAEGVKANPLPALSFALGNVLSEVETNGRLYPLNSVDHVLIEEAVAVFRAAAEILNEDPLMKDIDEMMKMGAS